MNTYLITGANGFVGSALISYLQGRGLNSLRAAVRDSAISPRLSLPTSLEIVTTGDIDAHTDWTKALHTVDSIVHLAGTVHRPDIKDPAVYQRSIVDATKRLTEQAITAKVRRLVYVSSAHVYGVEASDDRITEDRPCHPTTPYAKAKWQAEQWLQELMGRESLEISIVRPPLVYGPGVGGNFAQLMKLVKKLPILPFGCATQLRSLVGLNNLVAFLHTCMGHPRAANAVFNISDDADVSTRDLCVKLALAMHHKRLLLPIPAALMDFGLTLCGQHSLYNKLFGSVRLDISRAKNELGWKPLCTLDEQLSTLF